MVLESHLLEKPLSYQEYMKYWKDIVAENSSETARYQAHNLYKYAQSALEITQTVEKSLMLEKKLFNEIVKWSATPKFPLTLAMIVEPWCGDISHILPVLYAIEVASEDKIQVVFYLRDSQEGLIDQFLTNGGKAIPILLFLNQNEVRAKWGPRSVAATQKLESLKGQNLPTASLYAALSAWYQEDKTKAFQEELYTVFRNLTNN
jgi:hypothetical protein